VKYYDHAIKINVKRYYIPPSVATASRIAPSHAVSYWLRSKYLCRIINHTAPLYAMPPTITWTIKEAATTHQPQPLLTGLPLSTEMGGPGDICISHASAAVLILWQFVSLSENVCFWHTSTLGVLQIDNLLTNLTLYCTHHFIARRQIRCIKSETLCNRGLTVVYIVLGFVEMVGSEHVSQLMNAV